MAAGDIGLNAMPATVECDATARRIGIAGSNVSLVNVGLEAVFLKFSDDGDLDRDGLQHDGEIRLGPDDSIPLPTGATFVRHQCAAGLTTKLWYMPGAA